MALVKTYGNYVLFCLGVLTLLLVFVFQVHNRLDQTFRDSELTVRFSSEDSRHYVEMATAFHEGDWFEGIVERAHRQPLYPALLATAMAVGADSLRGLAVVNILVGGLTILLLLGIGRWVFARWWVGLIGALAYVSSEFIIGNIGGRLMTEPLYILVVTTTLAFALKYLETNRLAYLLGASAAAGLAYLTRPNGLFLFVAMWVTFLVHDLVRQVANGTDDTSCSEGPALDFVENIPPKVVIRHSAIAAGLGLSHLVFPTFLFPLALLWLTTFAYDLCVQYKAGTFHCAWLARVLSLRLSKATTFSLKRYLFVALTFAVLTVPSWLPRVIEYGDPLYHGYLPNYMWVDSYEEGHVGGAPRYTFWDYVNSHDVGDVVYRTTFGIMDVFWRVPDSYGASGVAFYLVALLGLVFSMLSYRLTCLAIAGFLLLQASPIVWTALSNGNGRVAYSALFPFLLIYVMVSARLFWFRISDIYRGVLCGVP